MKKRVLIVEDEATVALLIKESLDDLSADYEVATVACGEDALRQFELGAWDLVVTDQRMPGITGLELIESLRQKTPATGAILMTAYGSDELEQAARQLNVYHYMTKPFPLADLRRVIQEAFAFKQDGSPDPPPAPQTAQSRVVKVTLGGDGGVGKSALIRRLCSGTFDPRRVMTIGVDFHLYDVQHATATSRLIVWDVSGQDHFAFTRRAFYRGSRAVGLVYDVSNRQTFERLAQWHTEIRLLLPDTPLVLAGNKIDLGRQVAWKEGAALADKWAAPFFETSCANGKEVQEFFSALAQAAERRVPTFNPHPALARGIF